jgi:septal ring factor EnvC (AmiA/AmiB activator)
MLVLVVVFSLCSGLLQAVTKHDLYEVSQKIKELQQRIDEAYAELRLLNEEGGEQSQEQAQVLMAEIREMQAELNVLKKSLESMKNGGPKLRKSGSGILANRQPARASR